MTHKQTFTSEKQILRRCSIGKKQKPLSETDRLILRPLENRDYEKWLEGFRGNRPQQYKYDSPKMDLTEWTQEKFNDVIQRHEELAARDEGYILSVFRKLDSKHIGMVGFWTLMRREFQWGLCRVQIS